MSNHARCEFCYSRTNTHAPGCPHENGFSNADTKRTRYYQGYMHGIGIHSDRPLMPDGNRKFYEKHDPTYLLGYDNGVKVAISPLE